MSFATIFKKIVGIEHAVAPIVSSFVPGFAIIDDVFQKLIGAIQATEQTITGDKQGAARAVATKAEFDAGLAFTQSILATQGKKLTYDDGKLQESIAAQVLAFNKMAEVKASFKLENL